MAKKKLTQNDLDKTLKDFGYKVDDELDLPGDEVNSEKSNSNETNEDNEGDGDGQGTTTNNPPTGGPNPPPDKGRP